MTKEYPYKARFSFVIKAVVSEDKDKYLSSASLSDLAKFIPNFESVNLPTLLPISFSAFVANRVNKNDDVIDSATAIAIYKKFINVPINIEHKRDKVVGCVLTAGFSEFGTDKVLTEEQVKVMTAPFNVVLGGILWKVVNPALTNAVEDSNDPTSDNYMGISSSWELGFTEYNIVAMDPGDKNLEDGIVISDPKQIDIFRDKLKAMGGDGKSSDDKRLYRMPAVDVMPLAMGLVEKPAADVQGVATITSQKTDDNLEDIVANADKVIEIKNNISHSTNDNVKTERESIAMKLNSIKDITDESLKQITASQISDLLVSEITDKGKLWEVEKNKLNDQLAQATVNSNKALEDHKSLQKEIDTMKASLEMLNKEKADRLQVETFNSRMNEINEIYEFDEEVSAAIVDEIKSLASEEEFSKWKKKAAAFFKPFKKGEKKGGKPTDKEGKDGKPEKGAPPWASMDEEGEAKKKADAAAALVASASASEDNKALDKTIDSGEKSKVVLPNSTDSGDKSLKTKYASAFAKDQFIITV